MSSFGRYFRVTTYGESHGKSVGAIVDGCPPGLQLTESDIQPQLNRRKPGQNNLTTPRNESDLVTIQSGVEKGQTLGTPIGLIVPNLDQFPRDYNTFESVPRPGHADFTYQLKYGLKASSGGGRSSARETIGRVVAGAIADKWLYENFGTYVVAWVSSVGDIDMIDDTAFEPYYNWTREDVDSLGCLKVLRNPKQHSTIELNEAEFIKAIPNNDNSPCYQDLQGKVYSSFGNELPKDSLPADVNNWYNGSSSDLLHVRCPNPNVAAKMATCIREAKFDHDSTGGIITCVIRNVPIGLGEPCFDKLEALLAHGMLSLPATKGFEIGSGFRGTKLRGSQHNDRFITTTAESNGTAAGASNSNGILKTSTNYAGGTLGGISNGSNIYFRVAFKPVSTIGKCQETASFGGKMVELTGKGRHDPCVLPRAVPLIEAMASIVLMDTALLQMVKSGNISQWNQQNSKA